VTDQQDLLEAQPIAAFRDDILNKGVVLLNDPPLAEDERAVFCVLGTAGGGTTMTARLLEAAGIFMGGRRAGFNAEDPLFAQLLKAARPDAAAFRDLVARRNAAHRRWGFKAPLRFHPELLSRIGNVRYVVVFRDPVAAGLRTVMSSGARPLRAMKIINARQKLLFDFLARSDRPTLILSYEKALTNPDEIARALLSFTGTEKTAQHLAAMAAIVQPNEPTYVASQASRPAPVPEPEEAAVPDTRSPLRRRLSRLKTRVLRAL
jgi:hypothetical protein